jgi:Fe-S cluster assembly protein SufD
VYQGLISVDHDALDTDAYLTNNNLVLSDDARADSIPTLEIHTNEVRCSHGSTTGKLDESQIFYLNTRGYSPEEAQHLLVQGFFEEIVGRYPEIVSDEIHEIVEERIGLNDA